MKKLFLKAAVAFTAIAILSSCNGKKVEKKSSLSEVESIISQAEQMPIEELYKKAIEESNGKTMYGIGNSSRGKTAATTFIEELKKINPNYFFNQFCLFYIAMLTLFM